MPKLVLLRGIPGSGKSTLAKQLADSGYVRLNKDAFRDLFHNGKHSNPNEAFVNQSQALILELAMELGKNIVLDNTHGRDGQVAELIRRAEAKDYQTEVIVLDTPLDTCIRRDRCRLDPVGEDVIRRFLEQPFFKSLYYGDNGPDGDQVRPTDSTQILP